MSVNLPPPPSYAPSISQISSQADTGLPNPFQAGENNDYFVAQQLANETGQSVGDLLSEQQGSYGYSIQAITLWLQYLYQSINNSQSFVLNNNNVSQNILNNTPTTISFSTTEYDTTGGIGQTANTFTCNNPGVYEFTAVATLNAVLTAQTFELQLVYTTNASGSLVSGSIGTQSITGSVGSPSLIVTRMYKLNVNDTISVSASQNTGSTQALFGGIDQLYFQGKRIR